MENRDFQDKVISTLARLETKMDSVCKKQEDHEKRLRFLERSTWIVLGVILIITVALRFFK